ncbi:RNA-directed DNA polymerase, eukaryota, Reverse transcriptase zinc-binding domain protein [Artemisia annua]|uniref:RNA-directed DNA polymerase, eukaryota, Reverse transcriptase zinc-binding domain protein n=1 Tax=Artemisia annua TaxID=35608 RepID=A0A2U1PVL2_ARTAN|nr:RNA-directed DNA polymerase, eukaryota, Reverse transcriptase zinc-binding domain protein [Artemisia annua]
MRKKSANSNQNTSNTGRTSKRNVKVPNRFKDTDCALNMNRNNDNRSLEAEQEELLDNMGLGTNEGDKGKKEVDQGMVSEVDLTGLEFPTLDESIGKKGASNKEDSVSTDAVIAVSQSVSAQTPLNTDANKVCEASVDSNCAKTNDDMNKVGKTFADTVKPNKIDVLNKLSWIPTVMNEGREVVIAIASSLGTPIMKDKSTARMCEEGTGNIGYARKKEVNSTKVTGSDQVDKNDGYGNNKKNEFVGNRGGNKNVRRRQELRPVNKQAQASSSGIQDNGVQDPGPSIQKVTTANNTNALEEQTPSNHKSPKSPWKVSQSTMEEIKRSANKYAVLEELVDSDCAKEQMRKDIELVNKFVSSQRQPSLEEFEKWNHNMHKYFREQWKLKWNDDCPEVEEVLDAENVWNVRGMCNKYMQKDVKRFINDEKLSVCAVIETHLKEKQIKKVCEYVYGDWNWCSNLNVSNKGCRIIIGWNHADVSVMPLHIDHQAILCVIEIKDSGTKHFCCFVYAANSGRERKLKVGMVPVIVQPVACGCFSLWEQRYGNL